MDVICPKTVLRHNFESLFSFFREISLFWKIISKTAMKHKKMCTDIYRCQRRQTFFVPLNTKYFVPIWLPLGAGRVAGFRFVVEGECRVARFPTDFIGKTARFELHV